jgi:uncharacterized circularly permuted ATP-grasp superfamily protein
MTLLTNWSKFAKALPKIMDKALKQQKPFRNKFLKKKGLTYNQYIKLPENKRNELQQEWIKSKEFTEMNLLIK